MMNSSAPPADHTQASSWHAGELAVQTRAGVRRQAERLAGMRQPRLSTAAAAVLAAAPVLAVAGLDSGGRLWTSALTGSPPALPVDARHLLLTARPVPGDPLVDVLRPGTDLGMIAVDFPARRRVRVNGHVLSVSENGVLVQTTEVFGNCPQHITPRQWRVHPAGGGDAPNLSSSLTPAQQARLRAADTFVLGTTAPAGADASHRGGRPGVLSVQSATRVSWPDLPGNAMFASAGNLALDPRAALWLPPVHGQHTALLLSGTATLNSSRRESIDARRFLLHVTQAAEVAMFVRLAASTEDVA